MGEVILYNTFGVPSKIMACASILGGTFEAIQALGGINEKNLKTLKAVLKDLSAVVGDLEEKFVLAKSQKN